MMRRGHPLPVYPTDRKALFAAAPTKAIDLDMQNDAPQFAQWLKFYKSLFK